MMNHSLQGYIPVSVYSRLDGEALVLLDRSQQAFDGLRNFAHWNRQRTLFGYHTVHLNGGIVR
ncbi:hypothetical protein D3C79_986220 [compost metagenome]